jgi:hypothetical protein
VIPVAGRLSLGRDVPPGIYTRQVTVHDRRTPKRAAHQWANFEVRQ